MRGGGGVGVIILLEVYSSITVGTFFSNFLDFSQLTVDSSKNKTAKG